VNIPRFLESVVTRNEFVAHPDFAALYLCKGAIVFRSEAKSRFYPPT
jgi:hypothetical protein